MPTTSRLQSLTDLFFASLVARNDFPRSYLTDTSVDTTRARVKDLRDEAHALAVEYMSHDPVEEKPPPRDFKKQAEAMTAAVKHLRRR
jgi:hypothetical protein